MELVGSDTGGNGLAEPGMNGSLMDVSRDTRDKCKWDQTLNGIGMAG